MIAPSVPETRASFALGTANPWTNFANWQPEVNSGSLSTRRRSPAETDLPNLKIGYNKVFGYYLELSNTHRDKAPDYFIRKQTLKNAERYITLELKEYEEKVISADDKASDMEYEVFIKLRALVQASGSRLRCTALALAQLDVLAAMSELAQERGYCRPTMVNDPVLQIVDGRHPVLDIIEPQGTFVPNDTTTSPGRWG